MADAILPIISKSNQKSFMRTIYAKKVASLRALAAHTGLIAPCPGLVPSDAELHGRIQRYPGMIEACLEVIADQEADPIRRAACGMLLECFIPNWRDTENFELVGMVVDRGSKEVLRWRKSVLDRDNRKCNKCHSMKNLEVHHIVRWVDAPMLRIDIDNGMTLCKKCHDSEHHKAN